MSDSTESAAATSTRRVAAARILPLLDLTSLGDHDERDDIARLCDDAVTPHGPVAAVCVWPRFVAQAARHLAGAGVGVCAVANFPNGADDVALAVADARRIVDDGGDEVDVVVPWRALVAGQTGAASKLVEAVRNAIGGEVTLKAILETGELPGPELISLAANEALDGGADFLKTSTGKTAHSATLEAAAILLEVVADRSGEGRRGIKISGGVRDVETAAGYLDLADRLMGADWATAATFRFGASGLLVDLLDALAS